VENKVMTKINDYLFKMQAYWQDNDVNELTLIYFATLEDLNTYIASETYLFPDVGICFGI